MQKITILCVGKLKERFYIDAAAEYVKRLQRLCRLEVIELPESRLPDDPSPLSCAAPCKRKPPPSGKGCLRAARWWRCASRESPAPVRS